MLPSEKSTFTQALMPYLGKQATERDVGRWWKALQPYELPQIEAALVKCDRTAGGYMTPHKVINAIEAANDAKPREDAPAPVTHWVWSDLMIACNMKATAGENWLDQVSRSYDAGLAEVAQRVTSKSPELSPADAARAFLKQHPGWNLPVTAAQPF